MLLTLEACNDDVNYDCSADVNSWEWTPTDTLFYPVHVGLESTYYTPVACGYPYCLNIDVRSEKVYPAPVIPLHLMADREYLIYLDLGDENSVLNGYQSGSYYIKQFEISHIIVSFPDSGNYVLKAWTEDTIRGISSIAMILE